MLSLCSSGAPRPRAAAPSVGRALGGRAEAEAQQQLAQVRRAARVDQPPAAQQAQQRAGGAVELGRDDGRLLGGRARRGPACLGASWGAR